MTANKAHRPKRQSLAPNPGLTGREREILNLLADGLSNKEIAGKLDLSPYTVKNHLARIYGKLRARSRTAAVMAYLRR
jgi:DNA-binding CsgD family transcriptional regulator